MVGLDMGDLGGGVRRGGTVEEVGRAEREETEVGRKF